jgi:hypothetical protein
MRCTVPGSTPNCLAMTRTPGRPGVARASRIRFSSAGAIGGLDLATGIDAGEIDGPVWYPTAGPRGPLDRVAQIAERKYCRPHA